MMMPESKIYLIPLPIVENDIQHLPDINHRILSEIRHFVVERIRTARRFIRAALPMADINQLEFIEIDKRKPLESESLFAEWIAAGHDIGIMSESGTPCIADPGYNFVSMAQRKNLEVIPLVGPNSIILALMSSGLYGQQFQFHGYLPIKEPELKSKLASIQKEIARSDATQIFIETPYRTKRMFEQILLNVSADLKLCVAIEITSPEQSIKTKTIAQWKHHPFTDDKKNMIFLLGR